MSGLLTVGFRALFALPGPLAGFLMATAFVGASWLVVLGVQQDKAKDMLLIEARDAWLYECGNSQRHLDDCAAAWDKSPTLRDIHIGRVSR